MWRPALAGLLGFGLSLALEHLSARMLGARGYGEVTALILVGILFAPWQEELSKRLGLGLLRAGWEGTGFAFGVLEGLAKLRNGLEPAWIAGALSSVLLHWGLGRVAGRARLGLLWAILLHTAFNALFMFGTTRLWDGFGVVTLGLAALLLGLTFLWRRRVD